MFKYLIILLTLTMTTCCAQGGTWYRDLSVGSNALDSSSIFDVNSTIKGSTPCPVMTEAERDAISGPSKGLCVFNSTSDVLNSFDGTVWVAAGGGGGDLWSDVVDSNIITDGFNRDLGSIAGPFGELFLRADAASNSDLIVTKNSSGQNQFLITSESTTMPSGIAANIHFDLAKPFDNLGISTARSTTATATGKILIETGNNVSTGDSGDIELRIGSISSGASGVIKFKDGSEGISGECWVSNNTGGEGNWDTCPGGGDLWSDPVDSNIIPDGNDTRQMGSGSNNFNTIHTTTLISNTDLALAAANGSNIVFEGADGVDFTGMGDIDFTGVSIIGLPLGDLWSDALDSNIVPDGDANRSIGSAANNIDTLHGNSFVSNDDMGIEAPNGATIFFETATNVDFTSITNVNFTGTNVVGLPVSGANATLSNLTSPTAINQHLIPDGNLTLGNSTDLWLEAYIKKFKDISNVQAISITNRELNSPDGSTALSFNSNSQTTVSTIWRPTPGNTYTSGSSAGDWLSVYTRKLQSVDNLVLEVTSGKVFKFLEVSNAPTIGDVWTASATDGTGYWAAPAGGSGLTQVLDGTVSTTDATVTTIATLTLASDTVVQGRYTVVGINAAGVRFSDIGYFDGGNDGGVVTTAGGADSQSGAPNFAGDFQMIVSGTDLLFQVTGIAATNIDWSFSANFIEN